MAPNDDPDTHFVRYLRRHNGRTTVIVLPTWSLRPECDNLDDGTSTYKQNFSNSLCNANDCKLLYDMSHIASPFFLDLNAVGKSSTKRAANQPFFLFSIHKYIAPKAVGTEYSTFN